MFCHSAPDPDHDEKQPQVGRRNGKLTWPFFQRKKAWAIRSYPCTGIGLFLVPNINRLPNYSEIIQQLQNGAVLMDVGSFVGQDLRRLVFDGAPAKNLRALDLVSHWDVGYDLFRDKGRFSVEYAQADILDKNNSTVSRWAGSIDIISINHVLHQWVWDDQIIACKRLADVLAPNPGSRVVGCQIGNARPFVWSMKGHNSPQFRHTPESFAKLWDQVGEETGTTWKTQAWLRTWKEMGWHQEDLQWLDEHDRVIDFVVTRQ